ncbi:hypothetical protein D9M68_836450 [compost metagenome]
MPLQGGQPTIPVRLLATQQACRHRRKQGEVVLRKDAHPPWTLPKDDRTHFSSMLAVRFAIALLQAQPIRNPFFGAPKVIDDPGLQ